MRSIYSFTYQVPTKETNLWPHTALEMKFIPQEQQNECESAGKFTRDYLNFTFIIINSDDSASGGRERKRKGVISHELHIKSREFPSFYSSLKSSEDP